MKALQGGESVNPNRYQARWDTG